VTRIFKAKSFNRWARKEEVPDSTLAEAVAEMEQGLIDADLGGGVVKKRIAREGGGKSGGHRTIIAWRSGTKAFFMYGFPKSARENIDDAELRALRKLAKELFSYSKDQLRQALDKGALTEVKPDEEKE
jgi:hypothetical protein